MHVLHWNCHCDRAVEGVDWFAFVTYLNDVPYPSLPEYLITNIEHEWYVTVGLVNWPINIPGYINKEMNALKSLI